MKGTRVTLTIEVEAAEMATWQAVIKTGATILWRSKYKPSATEAFRVAAKLLGEMPVDWFWAASHDAPMSENASARYLKSIER